MGVCPKCKRSFPEDSQFCPDDGSRLSLHSPSGTFPTSTQPEAGWVIDAKYALERKLGEGGMGAVWLARHIFMEKPVALKLLKPAASDSEEITKRFAREAKLASQLDEPHVCAVYDCGRDPETGILYLAMEYLEGQNLRDLIDREKRLSAEQASDIVKQLLSALGAAHQIGIIHRDIKPENIMLVQRGQRRTVKLLDFGVAKQPPQEAQTQITRAGFTVGTPEYIAPEQALAGDIDGRADLYAAGVIFFELLTGRRPFVGDTPLAIVTAHVQLPVPSPREIAPDALISRELEQVVLTMLAKEPGKRYQDAETCRAAIKALSPKAVTTSSLPVNPAAPAWLRPAFYASAGLAALMTVLFLGSRGGDPSPAAPGGARPAASPSGAPPQAKALFQDEDTSKPEALLKASNFDEAKQLLTEMVAETPKSVKLRALLASAHAGKGEWFDARLHTEVLLALDPGAKPDSAIIDLALSDAVNGREARAAAAKNFLVYGYGRDAIPTLERALKKDPSKRRAAIEVLGELAPEAPIAVGILVKTLDESSDCADRASLARALGKAPRGDTSAISQLQTQRARDLESCKRQNLSKIIDESLKNLGAS